MKGNKKNAGDKNAGNKNAGNKNEGNKIIQFIRIITTEIFRNLQQNTINRLLVRSGRPNGDPPNGPPNRITTTTNNNTNKKKIIEEIAEQILLRFLATYPHNLSNEEKKNLLKIIKNLIEAKINEFNARKG